MHRGHQPDKKRPEPAKLPSDVLTFHNMTTFTGRYVNPRQLSVDDIDIRDIAHGLSNCCRFAGQCSRFYSVAEHSVHVSNQFFEGHHLYLAKEGLLHDAPEAYLGDLVKCVKFDLQDYKALEQEVWAIITKKFGIRGWWDKPSETRHQSGLSEPVHEADMRVLVTERHALISDKSKVWDVERRWKPYPDLDIIGYPPGTAKSMFLQRYQELFPENVL